MDGWMGIRLSRWKGIYTVSPLFRYTMVMGGFWDEGIIVRNNVLFFFRLSGV